MRLVELEICIDNNGHMLLPAKDLSEMGVKPGDNVTVAFLSDDGVNNSYREFLISSHIQSDTDEQQAIRIPIEILNSANIQPNEDIEINCADGVILILRADKVYSADLDEVLCRLGLVNKELFSLIQNKRRLPGDN
ncbi:MAG: hypothetical protein EOM62_19000 [Bacteroidia bacterium]|nr:hypothetical protein [Bacteroidia bacterium]